MNERIVKLISEADAYASTIVEKYTPDNGQVSYLWEDAFRKKFAELIVRECCQKLENDGMVEVAMELKEHFGVEE
jgi:hypothetical protein